MTKQLLKIEQVAERLNVEVRAAYQLLAPEGPLAHLRIPISRKAVRVDPDMLEEFLRNANANANS